MIPVLKHFHNNKEVYLNGENHRSILPLSDMSRKTRRESRVSGSVSTKSFICGIRNRNPYKDLYYIVTKVILGKAKAFTHVSKVKTYMKHVSQLLIVENENSLH